MTGYRFGRSARFLGKIRLRKTNGCVIFTLCLCGITITLIDIVRHYLLIGLAKESRLSPVVNLTNPFTDESVSYSNHDLATATYWASQLYFLTVMSKIFRRSALYETKLEYTYYHISIVKTS